MKAKLAKILGWGQFVIALLAQASNGHFPQNGKEWFTLIGSAVTAYALHHASSTDGLK